MMASISLWPAGTPTIRNFAFKRSQTTLNNLRFKVNLLLSFSDTAPHHHIMFSSLFFYKYLQVHYPVWPTGTHARGLTGGTEPQYQEPAGLWHRDKRWDSPLKPPQSSTPWPLTSKPRLGRQSLFVSHTWRNDLGQELFVVNVHYVSLTRNNQHYRRWSWETCCFSLSCYRRMHEECLIINLDSPHTTVPTLW